MWRYEDEEEKNPNIQHRSLQHGFEEVTFFLENNFLVIPKSFVY
jgi:hypothetical protein